MNDTAEQFKTVNQQRNIRQQTKNVNLLYTADLHCCHTLMVERIDNFEVTTHAMKAINKI